MPILFLIIQYYLTMFPTHYKLHTSPVKKLPKHQKPKIVSPMPEFLKQVHKKKQIPRGQESERNETLTPSIKINIFQDHHTQFQPSPSKISQSKMTKIFSPIKKLFNSPLKQNILPTQARIYKPSHNSSSKNKSPQTKLIQNRVPTFIKIKQQVKIQQQIRYQEQQKIQRQKEHIANQKALRKTPKMCHKLFWQQNYFTSKLSSERDNTSAGSELDMVFDESFEIQRPNLFMDENKRNMPERGENEQIQRIMREQNTNPVNFQILPSPNKYIFTRKIRHYQKQPFT